MGIEQPLRDPSEAATLQGEDRCAEILRDAKQAGTDFVKTELELTLTFCAMAAESKDPDKQSRQIDNAERAYAGALNAKSKLSLDENTERILLELASEAKQQIARIRDASGVELDSE
jgi:hypothetical protein